MKNKGIALIIFGIICVIVSFFFKEASDANKGLTVRNYTNGSFHSSGVIGGNGEKVQSYLGMSQGALYGGIAIIIIGIIFVIAGSQTGSSRSSSGNQKNIICPYCGEKNSYYNEHCFFCRKTLNHTTKNNKMSVSGAGTWICPKCGRVNQDYVGTCGCGEEKPL